MPVRDTLKQREAQQSHDAHAERGELAVIESLEAPGLELGNRGQEVPERPEPQQGGKGPVPQVSRPGGRDGRPAGRGQEDEKRESADKCQGVVRFLAATLCNIWGKPETP